MALISGLILFQMNTRLFVIILFMTMISILLVFIFKQPYKKINEEQMQQASILNSEIIEGLRGFETIKGNLILGSYMAFMTLAEYFMEPIGNLVKQGNIKIKDIDKEENPVQVIEYISEVVMSYT